MGLPRRNAVFQVPVAPRGSVESASAVLRL